MNTNEVFHNRHEQLTDIIYRSPGMLPNRYVFVLTNRCNLRCPFCYQTKFSEHKQMKSADWLNVLYQLPDYARVTLVGGEPLVFSGFREVFSEVARDHDCNLITNGTLLNEDWIDLLLSFPHFKVLSISIDDIGNKLRNMHTKDWEQITSMCKYFLRQRSIVNASCVLDIKTLVLDQNAENLFEIHKYCIEELGCDHHVFQFLKGTPFQHADHMYSFDDVTKKSIAPVYDYFSIITRELDKVRDYNLRTGKIAFLHPRIASLTSSTPLPDIHAINNADHNSVIYMPCKYPWSSVHINSDGTLFPCLAVPMGNVKKQSLKEIINGEPMKRFRNLIQEKGTIEGCNRCGWLHPVFEQKDILQVNPNQLTHEQTVGASM